MEITGEELYEAWKKWTDSEETRKEPFVIRSETWWGAERNMLVRDMQSLPGYASYYAAKLYNHKFRPITLIINKTHKFKPIEDGRFNAIDWR